MSHPIDTANSSIAALADSHAALGAEVRQVRKARQMTLKELARRSGASISHLSAIERGATNPSLDMLRRLADALDITSDWFFSRRPGRGPMERTYVVRRRNRRVLNMLYGEDAEDLGLRDELLSSSIGGDFMMGVTTYDPHSERTNYPLYQHSGEQHGLVLEGELELQIGTEVILLGEGDSYSFPAKIAHKATNVSDRPCKLLWASSPILFPKDVAIKAACDTRKESRAGKG